MQRIYAAAVAILGWFALILQLYLSVRFSLTNGSDALHGVWTYFAFYTILTNLLAATTLTLPALRGQSAPGRFFQRSGVITAVAANMLVVGFTYNLLLRRLRPLHGADWLADELLHVVLPLTFLVYWWLSVERGRLRLGAIGWWTIYPILYFAYAMLRGAATGFYPYPFVDVGRLGYERVIVNACGMLAVFVAISAWMVALKRGRERR